MATHIRFAQFGTTPFERLLGHNPTILEAWNSLEHVLFNQNSLEQDLLEQVRRTLAFSHECEYCMVKAGKPQISHRNKRQSIAIAFADMVANDHTSISKAQFDTLRQVFTEPEISALCAFICFVSASQCFGRIMNLSEEHQLSKVTSLSELAQNQLTTDDC